MSPNEERAQQDEKQDDGQDNETISRHALFIAQRTQAVHAAGGEIIDQARIAVVGPLKCLRRRLKSAGKSYLRTPSSLNSSGTLRGRSPRAGALTSSNTGSTFGGGGGAGFSGVREMVAPGGIGGGTQSGGGGPLHLGVELLDFGFQRGDLASSARALSEIGSGFFAAMHLTFAQATR